MLEGKKTYATAAVAVGMALASAFGYDIPEWVWPMLGAFGFGFLRAGVAKSG